VHCSLFIHLSLFIIILSGCKKETNSFSVTQFSHTQCKTVTLKNTGEQIQFKAINGNELQINHIDATFNCCPGELSAIANIENNLISISEKESESSCYCFCRYDLSYQVGSLEYKNYTLIIKHLDSDFLQFNLNFTATTDTTIVIN